MFLKLIATLRKQWRISGVFLVNLIYPHHVFEERCAGQSNVFVSKESSHTPSSVVPDPAAARCGNGDITGASARRCDGVNALCEETVDPLDMEAFFDAAGEFDDHYTGEILDRDGTIAGIRAELTQMQEFGVFEWTRKSEKPPNEKVTSTMMFHKAKGDEVRSRIVAWEFADGVFAPEHHAGTPTT